MKWACGVTTVIGRIGEMLPRTLRSLASGGFDSPHLFVDNCNLSIAHLYEEKWPNLTKTIHEAHVKTAGNWALALGELYLKQPDAVRYAVFQDDFVTCLNLRGYLERCPYPERGYLNLYTFPSNQTLCPKDYVGWYESNQLGRGAVALIFSREAVVELFSSRYFIERPQDLGRGWRSVDGGISIALKKAGWKEWVHSPSLTQHIGVESSMGSKPQKLALTFPGENFDALTLLR